MESNSKNQLPYFLQSYEDLSEYIRNTLSDLNNTDKGKSFARFSSKLIPITNLGDRFTHVDLGPDSKDGGVDLISISNDNSAVLYGQAKLTISRADEFDLIISKFKNYYENEHLSQVTPTLFPLPAEPVKNSKRKLRKGPRKVLEEGQSLPDDVYFVVVTLSKIKARIIPEYEKSRLSTRDYYEELKSKGRLIVIDGPDVLPYTQSSYRKLHVLPSNLTLDFAHTFIKHDNVFVGVLSAKTLKYCYENYGDALFLENIRSFLGYSQSKNDRENVNDSIRETAEKRPEEMLARNNGITFRAQKVTPLGENKLQLEQASIVNGCQTTMCIVEAENDEAFVLVKVVEVPDADAWQVAKSANFQNKVDQIALEVAKYMRPQALHQAASRAGILVEDKNETLYDIFDSIYQDRVNYDEAFYIFLGLFSKTPKNVISKNYTELRSDLLEAFKRQDPDGEILFELLFRLYKASTMGKKVAEEGYQGDPGQDVFQRFWKETKPDYRSLITILAATGCAGQNIYEGPTGKDEMNRFFDVLGNVLVNDEAKFIRYYCYAYETITNYLRIKNEGSTEKDIQRTMYDDLKGSDFKTLYALLCTNASGRERIVKQGELARK